MTNVQPAKTESVESSLRKIEELSPGINGACDAAQAAVTETEAFLRRVGVGAIGAIRWFDTTIDENDNEHAMFLVYARVDGEFRLAVTTTVGPYTEEEEDEAPHIFESHVAWGSCSRDVKLRSIEQLPSLMAKIAENLEAKVAPAEKAVAVANTIRKAVEGPSD